MATTRLIIAGCVPIALSGQLHRRQCHHVSGTAVVWVHQRDRNDHSVPVRPVVCGVVALVIAVAVAIAAVLEAVQADHQALVTAVVGLAAEDNINNIVN